MSILTHQLSLDSYLLSQSVPCVRISLITAVATHCKLASIPSKLAFVGVVEQASDAPRMANELYQRDTSTSTAALRRDSATTEHQQSVWPISPDFRSL